MSFLVLFVNGTPPVVVTLRGDGEAFAGSCAIASKLNSLSDEALELQAKLKALRRWLKDFTRLGEAIPTDVVLWNQLLVMAVVLDVADEVIKQGA